MKLVFSFLVAAATVSCYSKRTINVDYSRSKPIVRQAYTSEGYRISKEINESSTYVFRGEKGTLEFGEVIVKEKDNGNSIRVKVRVSIGLLLERDRNDESKMLDKIESLIPRTEK